MNEIHYIGEHLLPGQIGQFAIVLGFVSSLLAAVAYFFATQRSEKAEFSNWRKIGRLSFLVQGISVFTVMGAIFYVMVNKYFEYQYVWGHVSEDLPFRYIFSAFWEGQEGSFLLWMFWHVLLGVVLIKTLSKSSNPKGLPSNPSLSWEAPVLSVLSLVQVFLFVMILGLYFGEDLKIGSSPLLLLRDVMDIPLFNNADYIKLIQGNGLNPLLQNYWMTIHPPTLFLGFASTTVPFCFAVAGLWTNRYKEWLRPAMPWALFSAAILGTGILMGGAWAYEALSFGGYWAWDPVENLSLVPWLVLLAGIHTNLVAKNTGYSIRSTYVFYILTFILILYSTFMTRSGILGESSVHAFTEMGLESLLILFIGTFTLLSLGLYFVKYRRLPSPKKEESVESKEFWMFIGALVLLFSAAMITVSTSLPVYNKIVQLFQPDFDGLVITDRIAHYNKYQLWIAVFIGLISGFAQFLRFKEFNWKQRYSKFFKHSLFSAISAAILTWLTSLWIQLSGWQFFVLLFAAYFGLFANLDYLIGFLKGNLKVAASTFGHIGFGIMIVGTVASGLNKQHISTNPFAQRGLLDEEMLKRNVLLFKGKPILMSGYRVTYVRDTMIGNDRQFEINYQKLDKNGVVKENFTVRPTALYDNKITKIAAYNPATKHYLEKDIFTHIATLPRQEADFEFARNQEDSLQYQIFDLPLGKPFTIRDTVTTGAKTTILETEVTLLSINLQPHHRNYQPQEGDIAAGVKIAFHNLEEDTVYYAEPVLVLRGSLLYTYPIQLNDLMMKVRLTEDIFNLLFTPESELDYRTFTFKKGEDINFNGLGITFSGFDKNPQHTGYRKEKDDIAVGAVIQVNDPKTGTVNKAEPVYLIRGTQPFNLKDEIPELGLHFRFTSIDPNKETVEIMIAQREDRKVQSIPVEIALKSLRTDYIVLEAIIFPGINLFWLGSVLMMLGLGLAMWRRIQLLKNTTN